MVLAGAVLAVLATQGPSSTGSAATPCAPQPCAAPSHFQAVFAHMAVRGSLVSMTVTFHNRGDAGPLSANDYNHTSPADFALVGADHVSRPEVFPAGCPNWGELRIKYGTSAGPERLCFRAPPGRLSADKIVWSPDLGLLFNSVTIPIGGP
ncbi:MAG: hypothetical protein ACREPA_04510 [Candidatus Dormibacteraceae bacterium]